MKFTSIRIQADDAIIGQAGTLIKEDGETESIIEIRENN